MTAEQLRQLLVAPELVVIDLVDHALRALKLALLAEHPLVDDDSTAPDDPPVQRRARAILRRADDLRRALRAYRAQVARALGDPKRNDLPF